MVPQVSKQKASAVPMTQEGIRGSVGFSNILSNKILFANRLLLQGDQRDKPILGHERRWYPKRQAGK